MRSFYDFIDNIKQVRYNYLDGKLIRQTGGSGTIDFIYGASGAVGFKYAGTTYIYRRNLMGDVTHIYTTDGTLVARYVYDAWSNHKILDSDGTEITSNTNVGVINPIRYRGYYYDDETGLYYLEARYYDPETGRFISQDSIDFVTPENLTGLNLYVYCANNPVMYVDPNGHSFLSAMQLSGVAIHAFTLVATYAVSAVASIWDSDIRADMNAIGWNPFNTDADIAANANKVSFYKGSAVIKQDIFGTCAFAGAIWSNSNDSSTDIKHEWGHNIQELILGTASYIFNIAIPSVVNYLWGSTQYIDYYSMPWERTADWFGGVNRPSGYKKGSLAWAIAENLLGPAVIPLYFLFGY